MSKYEIIPINSSFLIELDTTTKFNLTETKNDLIEQLWKQASIDSQDTLFNGKIFSMTSFDQHHMLGEFIDYKYFVAQVQEPSLYTALKIEGVSVNGIVYCGDKILIGKRSAFVTQYKGLLETVPSGSINTSVLSGNTIDYLKALKQELEEETGIPPDHILEIIPFALIRDRQEHLMELCIKIFVDPSAQHSSHTPGEYQTCEWMTIPQVKDKIKNQPNQFVPLTALLLSLS